MFSTSIYVESRVKLMLVCLSPWLNHFKIVSSLIHLCFITLHFTSSLCVSLQNKITLFLHNHNYSFSKAVPAPAVCQIFLLICARSSMWIWPPPTLVSFPPSSQFTDLHVHTELFFSPYYRPCCIIGLCSLTSHPSSSTIMSVSKLSNLLHTGWKFLKSGADQTDRSSVEHPRFRFLFCFVYGPSNFWCGLYQQFTKILIKTLVGKDVVAVQLLSPVRLCDPMDCSTPGFPVPHHLPECAQIHIHWVGHAIQPSHPLPPTSPPSLNFSQHQGLFQWVGSLH